VANHCEAYVNAVIAMPTHLPILYSFRRCPYAMRARLAIRAAGISVELREVALRSKPSEMLAISPKGTVPVLQLPNGKVLEQSLDIMRWALSQHDPLGWLNAANAQEAHALIDTNDGPFKRLLDAYKYPERHPQQPAHQWRDEAVDLMLTPMEARLSWQSQLLGESACLVDMALLPFVRQFAQVDTEWFAQAPLPGLQRWLQGHVSSPLFDNVMNKYAVWSSQQVPVIF
jgi:glutathione S-transferase